MSTQPRRTLATWRDFPEEAERQIPHLWKLCYTKIYRGAENWCSPKIPAAVFTDSLAVAEKFVEVPSSSRAPLMITLKLMGMGFPSLFIAPGLFAAASRTSLPSKQKWQDIRLPLRAATLMLPRGSLTHPTDGPVEFISYSRIGKEEKVNCPVGAQRIFFNGDDCFLISTGLSSSEGAHVLSHVQNASTAPFIEDRVVVADFDNEDPLAIKLKGTDGDFLNALMRLTCSLLMVMSVKPELVERGHREGVHKKSGNQIWTPNIVGRGYRIAREASNGGSHASPTVHWRRGHLRDQRFGVGLSQVKELWIEPIYVNG